MNPNITGTGIDLHSLQLTQQSLSPLQTVWETDPLDTCPPNPINRCVITATGYCADWSFFLWKLTGGAHAPFLIQLNPNLLKTLKSLPELLSPTHCGPLKQALTVKHLGTLTGSPQRLNSHTKKMGVRGWTWGCVKPGVPLVFLGWKLWGEKESYWVVVFFFLSFLLRDLKPAFEHHGVKNIQELA